MRGIEGEQVLLRLILSESRQQNRTPMFRTILELLRREGMAGTTVLKGVAGFGHGRNIHTTTLEVASTDLPVVIEVVDTQEHIDRVLPKVEPFARLRWFAWDAPAAWTSRDSYLATSTGHGACRTMLCAVLPIVRSKIRLWP